MLVRALTGTVFVVILITATYLSIFSLFILYLLFVIIGSWEYFNILKKNSKVTPNSVLGISSSVLTFISLCANPVFNKSPIPFIALLIFTVFGTALIELYRNKNVPFSNITHTLFPIFYVSVPFGLLILANSQTYQNIFHSELILGFYFALWSNDTGAYLFGKAFGKHKLFERISPNKTWEGSIGGAFSAIGISILTGYYFSSLPMWQWIGIGIIISIFGSMGDLVESLFKRSMGVKDSGRIMPGHGGILDRFDGLLIAAPFVFAFLILVR
jgi:phosphatidate cytidylyltransferase